MGCIGGCFSCIGNTIYYLINFVFMLIGIALLSGGTILIVSFECTVEKLLYEFLRAIGAPDYEASVSLNDSEIYVNTVAIVLLSVGGFFVLLGMFAFMGIGIKAFQKIAVFIYIIFTTILLAISVFVIVFFALPEKPADVDPIRLTLNALTPKYSPLTPDPKGITLEGVLMDVVQSTFHCCGSNSYMDYAYMTTSTKTYDMTLWGGGQKDKMYVPPTCCRTKDEIAKYPNGDSLNDDISMDPSAYPKGGSINAVCFQNAVTADSKQVHVNRGCVASIYKAADPYQTAILISASVATAVFFVLIICLFVKLCSSDHKHDNKSKDIEVRAAAPTPQPVSHVPTQQPMYPGQAAYPGQPAAYPGLYPQYPGQR